MQNMAEDRDTWVSWCCAVRHDMATRYDERPVLDLAGCHGDRRRKLENVIRYRTIACVTTMLVNILGRGRSLHTSNGRAEGVVASVARQVRYRARDVT